MSPRQSPTAFSAQLSELADAEVAALRERQRAREAAVRLYETGRTRVAEAEQSLAVGRDEQAEAIVALLGTGLDANAVAQLFGIDTRRVREARSKRGAAPGAAAAEDN